MRSDDQLEKETFGCERCFPRDADDAWAARDTLLREVELIDESHFHVMILTCADCSQKFVSVFTETIDWEDGEDPQYWTLLPITGTEASELAEQPGSVTEAALGRLAPDRSCLRRDHPKAIPARSFWGTGIKVGFHD